MGITDAGAPGTSEPSERPEPAGAPGGGGTAGPGAGPGSLDHERYCDEIAEQTRLLRDTLRDADLASRVPTCPDWQLHELAVHVGQAHRWSGEIVRTRADQETPDDAVPGFQGPDVPPDDAGFPAALDAWLAEGARLLVGALRETGHDTPVWTWSPAHQYAGFWARRMAHETLIHRADVCLTAGADYRPAPDLAADCIDEWLQIVSSPEAQAYDPQLRELRERSGQNLHLHATDTGPEVAGEWLIELSADGVSWRRAHGKATVAVRGPLTDVLLVLNRRLPRETADVEVLGDAALLDFWLHRTRFGG